jgi:hypothetical protein
MQGWVVLPRDSRRVGGLPTARARPLVPGDDNAS